MRVLAAGRDALLYAPAEAHFNCPIGAATMGFELPDDIAEQLDEVVQLMTGAAYLDSSEVGHLPRIKRHAAGIVYGPLSKIPITADAVLVWMTARSAMLFAEAHGDGRWDAAAASRLLGRPGCAAIPATVETGSALSLGCTGMRTITQIADSHLLGVIAATRLDTSLVDLRRASQANSTMLEVYEQRAATFT